MPEGPEIRRMVDDIASAVDQCEVQQLFLAFERYKTFEPALTGRRVMAVQARGKAVLLFFAAGDDDGPWCIYSHNQLYGQWRIGRPDTLPRTKRQLRLAVVGPNRAARLYSASDIRLVRPDRLDDIDYLARLGPDPLNQDISVEALMTHMEDPRFRRRRLGGLLLDQSFVAGIGNYLRSEILFEARIAPRIRPVDLDRTARQRLAEATLRLLDRAYRLKGITNDPARARRLQQAGVSFGQRRHMVFNRHGLPCQECQSPIVKTTIASRRLYYCPRCQNGYA